MHTETLWKHSRRKKMCWMANWKAIRWARKAFCPVFVSLVSAFWLTTFPRFQANEMAKCEKTACRKKRNLIQFIYTTKLNTFPFAYGSVDFLLFVECSNTKSRRSAHFLWDTRPSNDVWIHLLVTERSLPYTYTKIPKFTIEWMPVKSVVRWNKFRFESHHIL